MTQNIKFAIVLSNLRNAQDISEQLLNKGIASYTYSSPDEAIEGFEINKFDFLLLDFDYPEEKYLKILDFIKDNEKTGDTFIIGAAFKINQQMIKKLKPYNIISILIKPITNELISTKIDSIINKLKDHFPERKHIRIQPDPNELLQASIRLDNDRYLTAKILDVSIGGLALQLYSENKAEELKLNKIIEHIIFDVENKKINVTAKIVKRVKKFIGLKFTRFDQDSEKYLKQYIMKKMAI